MRRAPKEETNESVNDGFLRGEITHILVILVENIADMMDDCCGESLLRILVITRP